MHHYFRKISKIPKCQDRGAKNRLNKKKPPARWQVAPGRIGIYAYFLISGTFSGLAQLGID